MSEFNRRESTKTVGELYPVLLSKDGKVIDGFHRLEDNPDWKTETLQHIDSEEKLLLARAISNWHRREVPRSEKEEWINGLAKIYKEQGVAAPLAAKIASETGLAHRTIMDYLSDEYKDESKARTDPRPERRVPASQRIETELGPEYVKRHREEVRQEIVEEVKDELRRDEDFRDEVSKEVRKEKVDELTTELFGDEKDEVAEKLMAERYLDVVISTFYKVRGWGVPMVLSMGQAYWNKALPYVQGINDWTSFLVAIKPEQPIEEPTLRINVDRTKIVEADFQIIEE